MWELKKSGQSEDTLRAKGDRLRFLARHVDLDDPEAVKGFIVSQSRWSNAYKQGVAYAYNSFVAVASIVSEVLFGLALGSGSMSETLVNISNNLVQMRMSILLNIFESFAIIVLATLLFTVLKNQGKTMGLAALGLYLAEATILAVSKTNALSLIPLSQEFVKAGAPSSSHFQALGIILLNNAKAGYNTLLLLFSLGGLLFFYLFYKSILIPRVLSIFGIIAVSMVLIGAILGFFAMKKFC